jgi:general secretion pathway protein K
VALLLVLWGMLALSLVAAGFIRQARTETRLAANLVENARAEALADAGVAQAMLALLAADPAAAWRADGRSHALELADGTVRIALQDEAGKVDLNRAGEPLLEALFRDVGGAPPAAAAALAAAVADFRDRDGLRRPGGAEDADYLAAGRPFAAKDAPFATVDELLQVTGMSRALLDRIEPYLTVWSPRRDLNPATAPAALLAILPNLDAAGRSALLAARAGATAPAAALGASTVTVLAAATTRGGGSFIREAVLRRGSNPLRPWEVLSWRRRWPAEQEGTGR